MVNVPSGWCLKHPRYRVQVQLRGQNWDFTFLAQAPTKPHFCSSTIQWLLEKVYQVYHFHSMSYHFIAFFITIHFISFHVMYIHPFSTDFHFNFVQLPTSSRKLWLFHATPNIDQLPVPALGETCASDRAILKRTTWLFPLLHMTHGTHEQSITRVKML